LSIKGKAALLRQGNFNITVDGLQMSIAILLLVLGILVAIACAKKLLEKEPRDQKKSDKAE
jgi:hypothetical protein